MRVNFLALCRDLRIQTMESGHHHTTEGWIQINCPFCGSGTEGWHLGYALESGVLHCWRCGKHSIREWLSQILPAGQRGQVFSVLKKYQESAFPLPLQKKKTQTARKRDIKPPAGLLELTQAHRRYLESRHFDPAIITEIWEAKGTAYRSGAWNWRVVVPIRDQKGRIVAYTGRALSGEIKPRWRISPDDYIGTDPKKLLYGIEKADPKKGVLIVEGPSDVWRMGPGAVGLLGIDWKVEQACILRKFERRFILFDPEPTAQKRARELANWLAPFPGETEILSGFSCDPGDLPQKKAEKIMKELGLETL
jgi:hypothetical protein